MNALREPRAVDAPSVETALDREITVPTGWHRRGRWVREVGWRYLVAALGLFFALFPAVWVMSAAFNPTGSIAAQRLIPEPISTINFETLFATQFWRWFRNSMIVAGVTAVGSVFLCALSAYVYSRLRFAGRARVQMLRGGAVVRVAINDANARYLIERHPDVVRYGGINQNYAWGQDSGADFTAAMSVLKPESQITTSQFPTLIRGQFGAEISALLVSRSDAIHSSLWGSDPRSRMDEDLVRFKALVEAGKTTAAGKLATWMKSRGKQPVLVACDLRRPAAVQQLRLLGEQAGVPVVTREGMGPVDVAAEGVNEAVRLGRDRWRRFFRHRTTAWGVGIMSFLVVIALAAPLVAPYPPNLQLGIVQLKNHPPSWTFILGTDVLSRDVWSRVVWGAQISLTVGVVAVDRGLEQARPADDTAALVEYRSRFFMQVALLEFVPLLGFAMAFVVGPAWIMVVGALSVGPAFWRIRPTLDRIRAFDRAWQQAGHQASIERAAQVGQP